MTLGLSVHAANAILDKHYKGPDFAWVQLHTGDPGPLGTDNIAGNAARRYTADSWGSAAGGVKSTSAALLWTDAEVDTSETYTHTSFWSLGTGGFCGSTGVLSADPINSEDQSFRIAAGSLTTTMGVAA